MNSLLYLGMLKERVFPFLDQLGEDFRFQQDGPSVRQAKAVMNRLQGGKAENISPDRKIVQFKPDRKCLVQY